jgi:hypothetical protein
LESLENSRKHFGEPSGFITESKLKLANILLHINAEIDLFSAKYSVMKANEKKTSTGTTITGDSSDKATEFAAS